MPRPSPLFAVAACFSAITLAGCVANRPTREQHAAAFAKLCSIEGDHDADGALVEVRRIARGTALQEEWSWPNGARELTVFFLDDGALRATHYCHSGVQSTMTLQSITADGELVFAITSATNLPDASKAHNTGFSYRCDDPDRVRRREQWLVHGVVESGDGEWVRRAR